MFFCFVFKHFSDVETLDYGSSSLVDYAFADNGSAFLVLSEYGSMNSQKMLCYGNSGSKVAENRNIHLMYL